MTPIVQAIAVTGDEMYKRVEIKSKPTKTEIYVDGVLVQGLKRFRIEQDIRREIPCIEMECVSRELNVKFERADIRFVFNGDWIECEKCLPDLGESVLALVKDRYGLHQEVLSLKHFEESDALYEGDYWCSYRTINIESMGICKVLAWKGLESVEDV